MSLSRGFPTCGHGRYLGSAGYLWQKNYKAWLHNAMKELGYNEVGKNSLVYMKTWGNSETFESMLF